MNRGLGRASNWEKNHFRKVCPGGIRKGETESSQDKRLREKQKDCNP